MMLQWQSIGIDQVLANFHKNVSVLDWLVKSSIGASLKIVSAMLLHCAAGTVAP